MSGFEKLRILVCGAGSIGRRHLRNLQTLGAQVAVWRQRTGLGASLAAELGVTVHADLGDAIRQCDAAVVATATDQHMAVALAAAAAGRHLFIEKPLAADLADVAALRLQARGVVVEVGCMLRASATLGRLRQAIQATEFGRALTFRGVMGLRLDQWRPGTDHRASYSADESRGGGALMDLIHLIDLVQYLFGPIGRIYCRLSHTGVLAIAGNDVSSLVVETVDGLVGQLQMDMISPAYRGEFEVVTEAAVLRWDLVTSDLHYRQGESRRLLAAAPAGFERNQLFLDHTAHFLRRLNQPDLPPICSLEDGIAALQVAVAASTSDREGRAIEVRPLA